jgi:transposase
MTHLQSAFDNITKTGAGYPKFKKRWENKSYTIQIQKPLKIVHIKNKHYLITIPSTLKNKLENIPLTCHIPEFIDNLSNLKVNSMTVSKNGQKQYFISIQAQEFIDIPDKTDIVEERSIGIDMGVVRPITTSDDCNFNNELFSNRIKTLNETDGEHKNDGQMVGYTFTFTSPDNIVSEFTTEMCLMDGWNHYDKEIIK